jgi:hypothetical protein
MVAVAGFSIAIYFWAQLVALPAERIQQTIDESSRQESAGAEALA